MSMSFLSTPEYATDVHVIRLVNEGHMTFEVPGRARGLVIVLAGVGCWIRLVVPMIEGMPRVRLGTTLGVIVERAPNILFAVGGGC